ncbi:MAG: TolB family protein, partial [Candidatus Methylomirabilales bacterium]
MAQRYPPWRLALALGMSVLPSPAAEVQAQVDRPTGWIVFHAGQAGKYRIASTDVLGAQQRDLTPGAPGEGNPSLPARGGRVAFQREGDIWALDLRTGQVVNLTRTPAYEGCPWFSGDGTQIAFDGLRDGRSEIFLMSSDGGGLRQLTRGPGNSACPAFSPTGTQVAFVSDRDGQMEIYLLDLKTGAERRLTDHPAADMDPAFSPDGSR